MRAPVLIQASGGRFLHVLAQRLETEEPVKYACVGRQFYIIYVPSLQGPSSQTVFLHPKHQKALHPTTLGLKFRAECVFGSPKKQPQEPEDSLALQYVS